MKTKAIHLFIAVLFGLGVVLLRQFYSQADSADLDFMLYPLQLLVSVFTGLHFVAMSEGYFHAGEDVLINASCAGANFWLICMSSWFGWMLLSANSGRTLLLSLLWILPVSWAFALLVNASRIALVIRLEAALPGVAIPLNHFELGAVVYISYLLASMLLLRKLTTQNTPSYV